MRIRNIKHKGLRWLYEENVTKGLSADVVDRLRKMLAFLDAMESPDELRGLPTWHAHVLTGDRNGAWSLHVTKNWRLTFRIADEEIADLDLEDYH